MPKIKIECQYFSVTPLPRENVAYTIHDDGRRHKDEEKYYNMDVHQMMSDIHESKHRMVRLEIEIIDRLSPAFGNHIGLALNSLLRKLPILTHLFVSGCDLYDYGLLSPRPFIPSLEVLSSDFLPSQIFQTFLRHNPTIRAFMNPNVDTTGFVRPGAKLPKAILPILDELSVDYSLIEYYLSGRPVKNVAVLNSRGVEATGLDKLLLRPLSRSPAGGGIRGVGGVLYFTLGWQCVLSKLHKAMPNLQHLTLKALGPMAVVDETFDFWMEEKWGNDFNVLLKLRTITAVTDRFLTQRDQSIIVGRWLASKSKTLESITFDTEVRSSWRSCKTWDQNAQPLPWQVTPRDFSSF
ncbi:hypothetical protein BU17DRAFT_64708 [Hysterangium stoloniferum]|nr:hypothetical protein BU17DRAFT_64708 [Hysterangium stoloniferum]